MFSVAPALRSFLRPVSIIEAPRMARRLGCELMIATESFQHTGSFKFRAAANVALSVPHPMLLTASSGNFGQALACACQRLDKRCLVVMPHTSAAVKVDAVREFGATVDLVDTTRISRHARVTALALQHPEAYVASPYDDPLVISGNATLGEELAEHTKGFHAVLAAVGGGGLTAGILTGLRDAGSTVPVLGVEPTLANDAARSLRAGHVIANEQEPMTIADGVRTLSLGRHNWAVLRSGLADVIEVTEEQIREGVRLLFHLANLKVEPTGALAVAALLAAPDRFRGCRVCCVVSGGNVDPDVFCDLVRVTRP